MNISNTTHRTLDGTPFTVSSVPIAGFAHAIIVNGAIYGLNDNLECVENPQFSLVLNEAEKKVRYFNVYRAADGGFVFGSRAFRSNEDRRATNDSRRAICGVELTYNEHTHSIESCRPA